MLTFARCVRCGKKIVGVRAIGSVQVGAGDWMCGFDAIAEKHREHLIRLGLEEETEMTMGEIRLPLQAMRANAERALERWEKARCTAEDSSSCERCSRVASASWVLRITDLFPDVRGMDSLLRIELVEESDV